MTIQLSCSTICFRTSPIQEALDEIKNAGFLAMDLAIISGLCPHYDAANTPEPEWDSFIALIRDSGLEISTVTCVPGNFNSRDANFDRIIHAGIQNVKLTARLGSGMLNINCGQPIKDRNHYREHALQCARGIKRIAQEAAGMSIDINVEMPHRSGLARSLDEAEFMMEQIDEPNVKYLLDCTHVLAGNSTPEEAVRRFGDRIGHVHLRDGKGDEIFFIPGDGDVNFKAFFDALEEIDYPGFCALELDGVGESLPERRESLRRAMQHLLDKTDSVAGLLNPEIYA